MLASSVRHGLQLWCLVDFINLKATTPKINLAQTVEEKETTRSTMHRSCTKNQQNCTESFCCKNEIQLACCFIFFTELILIAVPQLGTKIIYGSLFRVEEKEGLMMHNFISTFFLLKFILSVHIDFSLFAWKKKSTLVSWHPAKLSFEKTSFAEVCCILPAAQGAGKNRLLAPAWFLETKSGSDAYNADKCQRQGIKSHSQPNLNIHHSKLLWLRGINYTCCHHGNPNLRKNLKSSQLNDLIIFWQ